MTPSTTIRLEDGFEVVITIAIRKAPRS
jgi:hypothetical protein